MALVRLGVSLGKFHAATALWTGRLSVPSHCYASQSVGHDWPAVENPRHARKRGTRALYSSEPPDRDDVQRQMKTSARNQPARKHGPLCCEMRFARFGNPTRTHKAAGSCPSAEGSGSGVGLSDGVRLEQAYPRPLCFSLPRPLRTV
jgi:hypothetical protein